jgi:hypothetical protein
MGEFMSLYDYQAGRLIADEDHPFYALIHAAVRQADSYNMAMIEAMWPEVAAEARERYNAPGGLLPGEEG